LVRDTEPIPGGFVLEEIRREKKRLAKPLGNTFNRGDIGGRKRDAKEVWFNPYVLNKKRSLRMVNALLKEARREMEGGDRQPRTDMGRCAMTAKLGLGGTGTSLKRGTYGHGRTRKGSGRES